MDKKLGRLFIHGAILGQMTLQQKYMYLNYTILKAMACLVAMHIESS